MGFNYLSLTSEGVQKLRPYEPGASIEELESKLGVSKAIKLASNENPRGVSKKVIAACQGALANLNFYPDSESKALRSVLADRLGVNEDNLITGNGSSQLIEIISKAFLNERDEAIYSEYSFILYAISVLSNNATPKVTPAKNWGHDLDAMAEMVTTKTKIIYLANPNNPTGTWFTHFEIRNFLNKIPDRVIVVLDEAYIDYEVEDDLPDAVSLHKDFPNLIILRTFSKAYSLSALRVGYAIASKEIIAILNRLIPPFSVNSVAQAAAVEALNDLDHIQETRAINKRGIQQLTHGLSTLGIEYIPTAGNFITIHTPVEADLVNCKLREKGLIVRSLLPYSMKSSLRITIGLEEQNDYVLRTLNTIL